MRIKDSDGEMRKKREKCYTENSYSVIYFQLNMKEKFDIVA